MFHRNPRIPTRGIKRRNALWAKHSQPKPEPVAQPPVPPTPEDPPHKPLSQGQIAGGIVCMVFLVVLFPPVLIVFLIWGIVKVATR